MRALRLVACLAAFLAGAGAACSQRPTGDTKLAPAATASASATPRPKSLPPPPSFYAALDHSLDRAATNAECESCHQDVAAEWRASLHEQAYRDPSFLEAFAIEPTAFCRNCHTPELDPKVPLITDGKPTVLTGFAADHGIACVTCHLPPAGATGVVTASMPPGHRALVPRATSDDVACGGCHQFTFPDSVARTKTEWMQSTMLEHARSSAAGTSCRACHMPRVGDHASHRFAASRDPDLIARAAKITAEREGDTIVVTLISGELGHAFPTGDLLRRLAVSAAAGPETKAVAQRTVFLARHFGDEQQLPGIVVRVVKRDDRLGFLGPETRVVRLSLPGSDGMPVRWRVAYQRVQHLAGGEAAAKVGGEIVVAEGVL